MTTNSGEKKSKLISSYSTCWALVKQSFIFIMLLSLYLKPLPFQNALTDMCANTPSVNTISPTTHTETKVTPLPPSKSCFGSLTYQFMCTWTCNVLWRERGVMWTELQRKWVWKRVPRDQPTGRHTGSQTEGEKWTSLGQTGLKMDLALFQWKRVWKWRAFVCKDKGIWECLCDRCTLSAARQDQSLLPEWFPGHVLQLVSVRHLSARWF